ncbi:hypothetical protein DERP_009764 [Dermatophagoides pteronyssinus]|uniref:Uncharacterized protein n=1 Tax=Dermatophagoides pteronyssinus TaxID=6956 RepID=A0ABQ8IR91_DERPT|nr:hypothetical protein DERP_009764 [Dermatophagoides pteronyssinus]
MFGTVQLYQKRCETNVSNSDKCIVDIDVDANESSPVSVSSSSSVMVILFDFLRLSWSKKMFRIKLN